MQYKMIRVDLAGKVALVTAGGNALGEDIAKALALNGAAVAVCDSDITLAKNTADNILRLGGSAKAFCLDIMKNDSLMEICRNIEEDMGKIDILINNEKDTLPLNERSLLHEMDMQRYYDITDRELKGLYYMTKAVLQGMSERKSGVVINITSSLGITPRKGMIANVAAASATLSLTRVWALEMEPDNIRFHAIARGVLPYESEISGEEIEHMTVKRALDTEDVVGAVLYAVSDAAQYDNGGCITVDGGIHYGYMRNF